MPDLEQIRVPDIGDFDAVDVIDVLVSPGDVVAEEDGLITLESEKASMDVPSPMAGTVREVKVSAGGQVKQGDVIVLLEPAEGARTSGASSGQDARSAESAEPSGKGSGTEDEAAAPPAEPARQAPAAQAAEPARPTAAPANADAARDQGAIRPLDEPVDEDAFSKVYASPSVRRFARELGVDLSRVAGSGREGRILREDVQEYVKGRLAVVQGAGGAAPAGASGAVAPVELPEIDFSKWGAVETEELGKIQRLTGRNVHRSWITIPHVTQHDHADITELEAFRKAQRDQVPAALREAGVKLTFLPFLVKAVVAGLREFPRFNASLTPGGERLVLKKYFHVGIAVDTPNGLVVPVVRDADTKGLWELAAELGDLAARARDRKLKVDEMEGGCFSISSLGGIGGTAFTPIVNWPEVAILGVSRAERQPRWTGEGFEPRLMVPLSLSYDHRVIDGAAAVRFTRFVAGVLEDLRRLLL